MGYVYFAYFAVIYVALVLWLNSSGGKAVRNALFMRRKRRQLGFRDELVHPVSVGRGPRGEPGIALLAPSRSTDCSGTLSADNSLEYVKIPLGGQTLLLVVCLGTTAERGDAQDSSTFTMSHLVGKYEAAVLESPTKDFLAGLPATCYRLAIGTKILTEWKFVHHGWLFAVGIFGPTSDGPAPYDLGRRTLATWKWLADMPT